MQHNKTSLKFLFCGRPKTPKCFCTGLHIKKCRFETLIGRVIVFFSWARYFIFTVSLSTPRSINGYCQSVSKYWGNRKGQRGGGGILRWTTLPSMGEKKYSLLLWVIESKKFCLWTALIRGLISFKFVFCNQFLLISPPLFPFQNYEWPQRWKRQHDDPSPLLSAVDLVQWQVSQVHGNRLSFRFILLLCICCSLQQLFFRGSLIHPFCFSFHWPLGP